MHKQQSASSQISRKPVIIVQGGQWGSEAKGMVAAALCESRDIGYAVRTGTVNAGHTVMVRGNPIKMQQLPTGWVNKNTKLVIGAGAYVNPDILRREITLISSITNMSVTDVCKRISIDFRCGMHYPWHTTRSKESGRHHKMGATGKGSSEAVIDKINGRGRDGQRIWEEYVPDENDEVLRTAKTVCSWDTVSLLNAAYDNGESILVEGTQGTLLDLHIGPYPYTTHKQTQAASWLAECGLSCTVEKELVLVCRTFPIRVAGNSGPMPGEISWVELARYINSYLIAKHQLPRVSADSLKQFEYACIDTARGTGCTHAIEKLTQSEREANQEIVSELHKRALQQLPGKVVEDLCRLFEMTTVTKKLRRIARWDDDTMAEAFRLNRPNFVVITFMNYWVPTIWDKTESELSPDEWTQIESRCRQIEADHNVLIHMFSTGAKGEHLISRFSSLNVGAKLVQPE